MDPPLRERLSLRRSTGEHFDATDDRAAMARTGAVFAAAGGLFALLSVALPDARVNDEDLLLILGLVSLVFPPFLVLGYDRLPFWAFHAAAASGAFLISASVYAWGVGSTYAPLPYL